MKQILICVNYCHKNNVVHRDLKPGSKLAGLQDVSFLSPLSYLGFVDIFLFCLRCFVGGAQEIGAYQSD